MYYYGLSGKIYVSNSEPIKKGGEGTLYTVVGRDDLIIKHYHTPSQHSVNKLMKLRDSAPHWHPNFRSYTVPPLDLIFTSNIKNTRSFVGYTMHRIPGTFKTLAEIYEPTHSASIRYVNKIIAGKNLCTLTYLAHQEKLVIGDYNQKNIGVSANGLMTLFDNDSFQVGDGDLRCIVGVIEEMAPEVLRTLKLEKTDLCAIGRSVYNKYTDYYTMALHIFHLLMNGAHPFNHRIDASQLTSSQTVSSVQISSVEAAQKKLFVFKNPSPYMKPGLQFPSYQILSPALRRCFECSFIDGMDHPEIRPTPGDYYDALKEYQAGMKRRPCGHHHYKGYTGSCEWCRIERFLNITITA